MLSARAYKTLTENEVNLATLCVNTDFLVPHFTVILISFLTSYEFQQLHYNVIMYLDASKSILEFQK